MKVNSYKDLIVWQKSMDLVSKVYAITAKLPEQEKYGLISQLQRSSISIPSNIAEGSKRGSRADFRQFCKIALGSASELETQLLVTQRIYPDHELKVVAEIVIEVQKMLTALVSRLDTALQTKNYKL